MSIQLLFASDTPHTARVPSLDLATRLGQKPSLYVVVYNRNKSRVLCTTPIYAETWKRRRWITGVTGTNDRDWVTETGRPGPLDRDPGREQIR